MYMELPKILMPNLKVPGLKANEKIDMISEYLFSLEKNVRFVLNNLEEDNLVDEFADRINQALSGGNGEDVASAPTLEERISQLETKMELILETLGTSGTE